MARLTLKSSLAVRGGTLEVRELMLTVAVTVSGLLEGDFTKGIDEATLEAELRQQLAPLEGCYLDDVIGRATMENIASYLLVRLFRLRPYSVTVGTDEREATVYHSDIDYPHFERELLFKRGTSLALRGQVIQAVAIYSEALAFVPSAKIFNARGRCWRRLGNSSAALEDFNRAIDADPSFGEAYRNRGNVLFEMKRFDAALHDFTVAVERMPSSALAWNNRGYALFCMGRPAEALADHCHAINLDPNYEEAYRDRAAALQQLGHREDAQRSRELITATPERINRVALERAKLEGFTSYVARQSTTPRRNVLLITPDYISHYLPMASIGAEWQRRGCRVWVATGNKLRPRVEVDGFNYARLALGSSGIGDFLRTSSMSADEVSKLQESLGATAAGMVSAFKFQASQRENALLWHVEEVFGRLGEILDEVMPDVILSVHLAYNATAALLARGAKFATLVTGHYAQVPVVDEVYGVPYLRPARFSIPQEEFEGLEAECRNVQDRFTAAFNRFVQGHRPTAIPVANALKVGSPWLTLHNYPAEIAKATVVGSSRVHFIGPVVQCEVGDGAFENWYRGPDASRPLVVVSLGTFFGARADLLQRIASALAFTECRVAMAVGDNDISGWNLPKTWYVVPFLRQQAIMRYANLIVFHGGNNTFLEALSAGVPMLVGPLCSDEFAVAADVERLGLGFVFDPNNSPPEEIRTLASKTLAARQRAAELASRVRKPGAALACDLMSRLLVNDAS
jgi:tetratricopeptide (TPR) repeat protein